MRLLILISFLGLAACGNQTFTDTSCGSSVSAVVGEKFDVSLASTYWGFDATSDPTVVKQDGATRTSPSGNCVPGGGCGTATATFDAVAPGQATINASRTSCGEAMGCGTGQDQGICTMTVTVTQ